MAEFAAAEFAAADVARKQAQNAARAARRSLAEIAKLKKDRICELIKKSKSRWCPVWFVVALNFEHMFSGVCIDPCPGDDLRWKP